MATREYGVEVADDLPSMSASSHTHYAYDSTAGRFAGASGGVAAANSTDFSATMGRAMRARPVLRPQWNDPLDEVDSATPQPQETIMANQERVVQIYAADLDQNLPLDKRLIWQSQPIFTDLDNNDLVFDLASTITEVLGKHNEYRKTVRDKTIKDREQMLEPIRPRDLSVNITELAKFAAKK